MQKQLYIVHLLACAIHQTEPLAPSGGIDWDWTFSECRRHSISATVFPALKNLDVPSQLYTSWQEDFQKSMVKQLAYDSERAQVLSVLEHHQIDHIPLKGVVLKDFYPKVGMRMFCDNDILINPQRREDTQSLMRGLGYHGQSNPITSHDIYTKQPFFNFEIHKALLPTQTTQYAYWETVWQRAVPVSGHLHKLSDLDYYLFFLTHFYKHFLHGGCGIRTLLDQYLLLCRLVPQLDADHLSQELAALSLSDFADKTTQLAMTLFDNPSTLPHLTESDWLLFHEVMDAGTYGLHHKVVESAFQKSNQSKLRYILHRLFPSYEFACVFFPFVAKFPPLYILGFVPLCIFRLYRGLSQLTRTKTELTTILKFK